jgi:hypothetical protein
MLGIGRPPDFSRVDDPLQVCAGERMLQGHVEFHEPVHEKLSSPLSQIALVESDGQNCSERTATFSQNSMSS